jgi:hypothetical protein
MINHLNDERKLERQQLRIKAKRKATNISACPSKVIRQELQNTEESNLGTFIIPSVLIEMSFYCVFFSSV